MIVSLDKDFEPVTADDIPLIEKFLKLAQYEESNHNVVGFFLWQDTYPLWKIQNDHWLVLLGIHEGELFVYMPLCEKEYFKTAILEAKKIFDTYQMPFVLSSFIKEEMDRVIEIFPHYNICEHRDPADYVYLTDKFRTFGGKKLQKKRNHMNSFYKEYGDKFVYEKITTSNIDDCREFLLNWKVEDQDEFLQAEKDGVNRVFDLWEQLPVYGGLIRIQGKVRAFIVGSLLTERMCQINIEKADHSYRGLYQAILREFLLQEFEGVMYMNREDDMGKENIRKAKLAYYPEYLIPKYRLCEEEPDDYKGSTIRY